MLIAFGTIAFLLLPTALLAQCNSKQTKSSKEKSALKKSPAAKQYEKKPTASAKTNSTESGEEPAVATAIARKSERLRTAQKEDSFDRLKPRVQYVDRYKEIGDAPKVDRKDGEYDTLKMIPNEDFGSELVAQS